MKKYPFFIFLIFQNIYVTDTAISRTADQLVTVAVPLCRRNSVDFAVIMVYPYAICN